MAENGNADVQGGEMTGPIDLVTGKPYDPQRDPFAGGGSESGPIDLVTGKPYDPQRDPFRINPAYQRGGEVSYGYGIDAPWGTDVDPATGQPRQPRMQSATGRPRMQRGSWMGPDYTPVFGSEATGTREVREQGLPFQENPRLEGGRWYRGGFEGAQVQVGSWAPSSHPDVKAYGMPILNAQDQEIGIQPASPSAREGGDFYKPTPAIMYPQPVDRRTGRVVRAPSVERETTVSPSTGQSTSPDIDVDRTATVSPRTGAATPQEAGRTFGFNPEGSAYQRAYETPTGGGGGGGGGDGGGGGGMQRGGVVQRPTGGDLAWQDVGRSNPKMRTRLDDWAQAVAERAPESENIEDRRAGESTLGYYGGKIADTARNIAYSARYGYQQGGPVQTREPTHVTHNRANQRMIAHIGRRDPARAAHLMQGLRRQHNGLRAMATAALAHSYGLRQGSSRHELAHGHDAHALHLLNMAHAQVPDDAELHFSQHGDHDFNARVHRNGRATDFPLNRRQLMAFSQGLAGQFDSVMHNGVERNLAILRRGPRRRPVPGYQGGGEVYSDPYTGAELPPVQQQPDDDSDPGVVRRIYNGLLNYYSGQGAQPGESERIQQQAGGLGRTGVPAVETTGETPGLPEAIQPGGSLERAIEERHQRYVARPLQNLLNPTTNNSASSVELEQARREAELATTVRKPEEIPAVLRGGREGRVAEPPIQYQGASPEEVTAALGPQAGEATRREIERISRESGNRPVDVVRSGRPATEAVAPGPSRTEERVERVPITGPRAVTDIGGQRRAPSFTEFPQRYEDVVTRREIPGTPGRPAQPAVTPYQVTAPRPGEVGYTPRPEEAGYVKGTPTAPDIPLTPGRSDVDIREAGRRFPGDIRAQEQWLATRPRDPNIPTPEQDAAAREAAAREYQQRMMVEDALAGRGGKGGGAGAAIELLRQPQRQQQIAVQQQKADIQQQRLEQKVVEELGRRDRQFAGETGKVILQKLRDDPSGKSLSDNERAVLEGAASRARKYIEQEDTRGGATAAPAAPVRVNSPEEARNLPSGTPIILPDGRTGTVP